MEDAAAQNAQPAILCERTYAWLLQTKFSIPRLGRCPHLNVTAELLLYFCSQELFAAYFERRVYLVLAHQKSGTKGVRQADNER